MYDSMQVSGTHSWKKPGGPEGVLVFEGGSPFPSARGFLRACPQLQPLVQPYDLASSHPA
jgi:hypothetical protein